MTVETRVAEHYTTGSLLERIKTALTQAGADADAPRPDDLKPVDEFHTGGLEATEAILGQLEILPETRVLDIGSGIGGTARLIAARAGAHVTGVDLTPAFVETARALSEMVGLADRVTFHQGSALALPVADGSADLALVLHVGMNIADKAALMAEAARALAPGGRLVVFDVMGGMKPGELAFPLPWSSVPATSFVEAPDAYTAAARAVGLRLVSTRDRSDFAEAFFQKVFARIASDGQPPVGIHLLMGETAGKKIENYVSSLRAGLIAPTEMIFEKPGEYD